MQPDMPVNTILLRMRCLMVSSFEKETLPSLAREQNPSRLGLPVIGFEDTTMQAVAKNALARYLRRFPLHDLES
jgi:hypothetical protein